MSHSRIVVVLAGAVALALAALGFTAATSRPALAGDPSAAQDSKAPPLPPGMTQADMTAMMDAATPGPMQAYLTKDCGTWTGASKYWMSADSPPDVGEISYTCTAILGGRFIQQDCTSEMPGMPPFQGLGLLGYDNVAKVFQSVWIDSMGTCMATGTGSLSSDEKTLTINSSYTCPVRKKCVTMRQVTTRESADRTLMRMYMPDMATGKEFLAMDIVYTRTGPATK